MLNQNKPLGKIVPLMLVPSSTKRVMGKCIQAPSEETKNREGVVITTSSVQALEETPEGWVVETHNTRYLLEFGKESLEEEKCITTLKKVLNMN